MRYLLFGMKNLNESQIENSAYSHKNLLAVDYCGKNSGIENWYAFDGYYKVLAVKAFATTGFANTLFITPCYSTGTPCKVKCADGIQRHVTIALSHDNVIKHKVGEVIKKNGIIYSEGTTGNASGNHIHLEIGEGLQYTKIKSNGQYRLKNALYPSKMFYVREDKTVMINGKNRYKILVVPKAPESYLKREYPYKHILEVKKLQECLNYVLGCNLTINGHFGAKTEMQLEAFQKLVGLPLTKHYGNKTKAELKKRLK